MGSLRHFDVKALAREFGCKIFVETGTGLGNGLWCAQETGVFEELYSIEINAELAKRAIERFAGGKDGGRNLHILVGSTEKLLSLLLPVLEINGGPVLFWLDAHFPGADFGLARYDAEPEGALRMPLRRELGLVRLLRPEGGKQDVLLIDDARLFTKGPFWAGDLPERYRNLVPEDMAGVDWINEMWSDTHDMVIDYADEGYIILKPKSVK